MKVKYLFMQLATLLAATSLYVGIESVSKACWWWFAQPKVPEALDRFRSEK